MSLGINIRTGDQPVVRPPHIQGKTNISTVPEFHLAKIFVSLDRAAPAAAVIGNTQVGCSRGGPDTSVRLPSADMHTLFTRKQCSHCLIASPLQGQNPLVLLSCIELRSYKSRSTVYCSSLIFWHFVVIRLRATTY
jgi:hypothetical protein